MAQSKQASPAVIAVAVIIALLVIGGIWYKTLGPGSQPAGVTDLNPGAPPEGAGPSPPTRVWGVPQRCRGTARRVTDTFDDR
jgi:hypothetical protein